ncbi:MAG: hypothetical protein R3A12_13195 [Ignavibacteria bacterium]
MEKKLFNSILILLCFVLISCGKDEEKTNTTTNNNTSSSSDKIQLLYVQTAEDITVDSVSKTFRLVNVNQQTLYFSDRPDRIAGHEKLEDYLNNWTSQGGKDSFAEDPPNASLSVYQSGKSENSVSVVEITNPVIDGKDLVYNYKVISGTMPVSGGLTSLL